MGSAIAASAFPALTVPARASGIEEILRAELDSGRACGANAAAIEGTLSRLARTRPPGPGKTVVIDMPSQHLAAYRDGVTELESRVVVGDPSWQTPDLDTRIVNVRYNPTWTVPESILKARGWRSKLDSSPEYFRNLNFLVELDGAMVDPFTAAGSGSRVGRFVQQPGEGNALGQVKFPLADGDAIYLHDTNDYGAFGEDSRALSHGCVRVERAVELAAWVMDIGLAQAQDYIYGDDRREHTGFGTVRVVTTYFTAWPDANGNVLYYPDIYGRDGASGGYCGEASAPAWGSGYAQGSALQDNAPPQEVIIYAN
jgi:Uncharacterized protein conserved in bacteria